MRLNVPRAVRVGHSVTLGCEYDLEGSPLYSVKWYRDSGEFYRYVPKEEPPTRVFPQPGLHVDSEEDDNADSDRVEADIVNDPDNVFSDDDDDIPQTRLLFPDWNNTPDLKTIDFIGIPGFRVPPLVSVSDAHNVTLMSVGRNISGLFQCEVSADAPLFHTQIMSAPMTVAENWIRHYENLLTENRKEYREMSPTEIHIQEETINIDERSVIKTIQLLKNDRAAGPEGIPAELIKCGTNKLFERLTCCINQYLNNARTNPA
ncbi:unnamed protein product [Diabrotica balteata]|uniref:Ig-like domain-containing protein n=1 Tax=Diabrotica balteata TaxID=107213 RepID=A0A9N9T2G8_DIABA|nr:unnamed protein product [Diabrotica balteata]